jgi:membrane protease YdiL (CAAX protease family)
MNAMTVRSRSLINFVVLELLLSIPFWGIGVLATAGVIPDQVIFRASWSLTPMIAASILIYREGGAAGVAALFRRILDFSRARSRTWYLAVLLLGPFIVFTQYGLALLSGSQIPAPQLTLLVPISYFVLFLVTPAEELGWTGYVLDTAQTRWSALTAGLLTGALWASMHAPVWLFAGQSLEWCLWQMLYVVAIRVLMVWVYNNMGRSLFAMDLLHPGFFVWWYLWPVDGTGLSVPSFYDPRNLAITAIVMAAVVTFVWGRRTLASPWTERGQVMATGVLGSRQS